MQDAIFLSASVPDPARSPGFAETADSVAITAAVSALVYVVLGRRLLVWGGHPAITPMILVVAEDFGVDYGRWVKLYQSRFFKDDFPEDNERFQNVVFTDDIGHDREKSLLEMRRRMFVENSFVSAVFIGGMDGIVNEFELFRECQPMASVLPVLSTGGATLTLADRMKDVSRDLLADLDYVGLFHRHLGISTSERRYSSPEDQPENLAERLWEPPTPT